MVNLVAALVAIVCALSLLAAAGYMFASARAPGGNRTGPTGAEPRRRDVLLRDRDRPALGTVARTVVDHADHLPGGLERGVGPIGIVHFAEHGFLISPSTYDAARRAQSGSRADGGPTSC